MVYAYTVAGEINWAAKLSLNPPKGWRFVSDLYGDRLHSYDEWEWRIELPRGEDVSEWANGFFLVNLYLKQSKRYASLDEALTGYQEFECPEQYPPQVVRSDWEEF